MKIVILDGYTENPGDLSWDGFEKLGKLTVYDRTADSMEIVERIGDAQVVYTNKTPITKKTIESCRNLKYIGVLATGYNVVDVKAAKEAGVDLLLIFQLMGRMLYHSLQLRFCWNYATILVNMQSA